MSLPRSLLFLIVFTCASASAADPTANIQRHILKNGMTVVLAPSPTARTVGIEVEVRAGTYSEEPGQAGVAHLLEHYLFTDAKLNQNLSYLDIIKEKGGSANAETAKRYTSYYATVPATLTPWIIDAFTKMIFTNSFDEERTERSKGPVFLEIGRPSVFDYATYTLEKHWPHFAQMPDFMETEFNVELPDQIKEADRLFTAGLRSSDLKRFYEKHYRPSNLNVYLAGNFNPTLVLSKIEKLWGQIPSRPGTSWTEPERTVSRRNYTQSDMTSLTPEIKIGSKIEKLNFEEEISAKIYLGSLVHRLMKEFRNNRGETYTVSRVFDEHHGTGFVGISLEAPTKSYYRNLSQIRAMIDAEARQLKFTPAMFEEAKMLFLKDIDLADSDTASMMDFAKRRQYVETNYANCKAPCSDYSVAQEVTFDKFQANLKKTFAPNMQIEFLTEPPIFFRFENILMLIFGFALWMVAARRVFSRPFKHDQIRWGRKLVYPPAYTLNIAVTTLSLISGVFLALSLSRIAAYAPFVQSSFILSSYLSSLIALGAVIFCFQCVMALCTRKISVVGETVIIKSLGYFSSRFALSEIETIELASPLKVALSPRLWPKLKHRFQYFDLLLWRKGILISLHNGRSYFLSVTEPTLALEELKSFLQPDAGKIIPLSKSETTTDKVA